MARLKQPAILGGTSAFAEPVRFIQPSLPTLDDLAGDLRSMLASGQLTNNGPYQQAFERALSAHWGAGACCSAVTSCTVGLMLGLRALGRCGEVICPSFTFAAAAEAILWSGNRPRFVDIDPETWAIRPDLVHDALGSETVAVLALHPFGVPADIAGLQQCCDQAGVPLLFDSAHAFGSKVGQQMVGMFGTAEVFSFHATKLLPLGEGGAVVSRDPAFIHEVNLLRNFGIAGDQDASRLGLNGKMQEFNAIIGLRMLERSAAIVAGRRDTVRHYQMLLGGVPGLRFQHVPLGSEENGQYFPALVSADEFGLTRDELAAALAAEGIGTRRYFYPPVHRQPICVDFAVHLPMTEAVSNQVLCLPVQTDMPAELVEQIAATVWSLQQCADAIRGRRANDDAESAAIRS